MFSTLMMTKSILKKLLILLNMTTKFLNIILLFCLFLTSSLFNPTSFIYFILSNIYLQNFLMVSKCGYSICIGILWQIYFNISDYERLHLFDISWSCVCDNYVLLLEYFIQKSFNDQFVPLVLNYFDSVLTCCSAQQNCRMHKSNNQCVFSFYNTIPQRFWAEAVILPVIITINVQIQLSHCPKLPAKSLSIALSLTFLISEFQLQPFHAYPKRPLVSW
jgi:hypothetical protein